jgi:hypothetical protein
MPEIKGKLPVFPAQGKLTFNGEPIVDADLTFYPIEAFPKDASKILPHARTGEDGAFGISTYGITDGAPAGRYRVTASWKDPGEGTFSREQLDGSEEKLPQAYQNPRITQLKVEVKEGETNELPTLEISSQKLATQG